MTVTAKLYSRGSEIRSLDVGSQFLVFEDGTEKFYALNDTASILWNAIEKECNVSDICAAIEFCTSGGPSGDSLAKEISLFLENLEQLNIVRSTQARDASLKFDLTGHVAHSATYEPPNLKEIPADWLKSKRPGSYYRIAWSDRWKPNGGECD